MVRYFLKYNDPHWKVVWDKIRSNNPVNYRNYWNIIDEFLDTYNGKIYLDDRFEDLKVVGGIEFKTEEDLTFFKLTFN